MKKFRDTVNQQGQTHASAVSKGRMQAAFSAPNLLRSKELALSFGTLRLNEPLQTIDQLEPGLKLAFVLSGHIHYRLPDSQKSERATGTALHLQAVTQQTCEVWNQIDADAPLQYVSVFLPQEQLEGLFDFDLRRVSHHWQKQDGLASAGGPLAAARGFDVPLLSLARQMLACPIAGPARKLYLTGKSLELVATALQACEQEHARPQSAILQLHSRDLRRLERAREMLHAHLDDPPSLPELARQVGINVTKLTKGFRQAYACSVYDYVREQRMQHAWRLLSAGEISIGAAARLLGYSDSHFTKVFKKRFGVLPGNMR